MQQGQSELAQGSEVVGRMVFAHSAIVLAERDIKHPVQTVLDAPVFAQILVQSGQVGDPHRLPRFDPAMIFINALVAADRQ